MSFEEVGKHFVNDYYFLFDKKETRANVMKFYHENLSLLTFEGSQFQGARKIGEKLMSVPLESLNREITTLDCQPTVDGGVFISVVGQLQNNSENDKPMGFCHCFILKFEDGRYYIGHESFRLTIHNH